MTSIGGPGGIGGPKGPSGVDRPDGPGGPDEVTEAGKPEAAAAAFRAALDGPTSPVLRRLLEGRLKELGAR